MKNVFQMETYKFIYYFHFNETCYNTILKYRLIFHIFPIIFDYWMSQNRSLEKQFYKLAFYMEFISIYSIFYGINVRSICEILYKTHGMTSARQHWLKQLIILCWKFCLRFHQIFTYFIYKRLYIIHIFAFCINELTS